MRARIATALCAACLWGSLALAQSITGTVEIKRRLSRPSVAVPVSVYQRGTVVAVAHDAATDPIAYEQSRVAIYLEGATPPREDNSDKKPLAQMKQADRRFVPDFVVISAGSSVLFPNMDPIFHNIYSLSKAKSFDLGNYDQGQSRKVNFPKAGIVDVFCHLHSNMAATIVVAPTRWYAQPDRAGKYTIEHVPPGEYTVVAWHKTAGYFRKKVTVGPDRDATVDFFIPLEAEAPGTPDKHEGSLP